MRLIALRVFRNDSTVRSIEFRPGLNLILDAQTIEHTDSGNSVGKTTALRLIDYCLGSDGTDIWRDSEFIDQSNEVVFDFLHDEVNQVSVELHVLRTAGQSHVFRRWFVKRGRGSGAFIDGEQIRSISAYRDRVKGIMFGSESSKPTLRQLMPKFVRSSQASMTKTLKVLGEYGSAVDYEALHLFLFGFGDVNILERRPALVKDLKRLERDLSALTRVRKEGAISQLLVHSRKEVGRIVEELRQRNEVPGIARSAQVVADIRSRAIEVGSELAAIESELSSIGASLHLIDDEIGSVDYTSIEGVYREASRFVPDLQKSFEQMSEFVRQLRLRKRRYLEIQSSTLGYRAAELQGEIENLRASEEAEIGAFESSSEFVSALEVRSDLQEKLKEQGALESSLREIQLLRERISKAHADIESTVQKIESELGRLQERVALFNEHFSRLSKQLYGEQYILHYSDPGGRRAVTFELAAVGSHVDREKRRPRLRRLISPT